MPVKHWSFAGLVLTTWCNARCASCYLGCGPGRDEWVDLDAALAVWRGLVEASPHGCRIHLTGGEPFGDWPLLIALCERANAEGLGPVEKVETNAYWATDRAIVVDRVKALRAAGVRRLAISADPYHQQFVPIENCRRAAAVAGEILGPDGVRVRWADWLAGGGDTSTLSADERDALFARYAADGRDRMNGRAADLLAPHVAKTPLSELRRPRPCAEALLRSRHVHVGPDGTVTPGVCAGIILGRWDAPTEDFAANIGRLWADLSARRASRVEHTAADGGIVDVLASVGPAGLLEEAVSLGFEPEDACASRCHLCWRLRRFLAHAGRYGDELGPGWLYE